jgi:hypothetical protein
MGVTARTGALLSPYDHASHIIFEQYSCRAALSATPLVVIRRRRACLGRSDHTSKRKAKGASRRCSPSTKHNFCSAGLEKARVQGAQVPRWPGGRTSRHGHRDYALYAESSFKRRLIFPDGRTQEIDGSDRFGAVGTGRTRLPQNSINCRRA